MRSNVRRLLRDGKGQSGVSAQSQCKSVAKNYLSELDVTDGHHSPRYPQAVDVAGERRTSPSGFPVCNGGEGGYWQWWMDRDRIGSNCPSFFLLLEHSPSDSCLFSSNSRYTHTRAPLLYSTVLSQSCLSSIPRGHLSNIYKRKRQHLLLLQRLFVGPFYIRRRRPLPPLLSKRTHPLSRTENRVVNSTHTHKLTLSS